MSRPIVVKVGGSLLDWPELKSRLNEFLEHFHYCGDSNKPGALATEDSSVASAPGSIHAAIILVPGGGRSADVVRQLDQTHGLGETASHWIALRSMSVNAMVLKSIVTGGFEVIDPIEVIRDDKTNIVDACWSTTSDSIAARIAVLCGASELVLLKSASPPGETVREWAAAGYVDPLLQCVLSETNVKVSAVNLRDWRPAARHMRSMP